MLRKYQIYDNAIKIETEQLFRQELNNDSGYVFAYGELKAIDTVSFSGIEGEYSYIQKKQQKYRKHNRLVTETYHHNGRTKTRTRNKDYWTWDTIKKETKISKRISFLGVEFEYSKVPFPASHKILTTKTGKHSRNIYYGVDSSFKGTIFTVLKNNTISETSFYPNQTIEETINELKSEKTVLIFRIIWILATLIVSVIFYKYKINNQ